MKNCYQCGTKLSFRTSFVFNGQPVCKTCLRQLESGGQARERGDFTIKLEPHPSHAAQSVKSAEEPQKAASDETIEVSLPSGEIRKYSVDGLRKDILAGNLRRDYKARTINKQTAQSSQKKKPSEPTWSTLEKVSDAHFELRSLYKPIWAFTLKWLWYGVIACIGLKALDTTVLFFAAEPVLGVVWLLVIGSLFLKKWWAPLAIILVASRLGIQINLFITVLAVGIIGAVIGVPFGMVVGTLVGHFKAKRIQRAPDAVAEGGRPYYFGLLLPLAFLCIIIPLYLFWLNPILLRHM